MMAKKGVFGLFWPPLLKEGDHEVVEDFSKSYPSGASEKIEMIKIHI